MTCGGVLSAVLSAVLFRITVEVTMARAVRLLLP